jgi:formamidopyrimidine-DNA glycosylase
MDQSVVAGLGNLTVDELLWRAGLHPRVPVSGLDPAQVRRLHAAMRQVLPAAAMAGRVPGDAGWLTGARDARNAACPCCGTTLRRSRVGGRATVWCPGCQH